MNHSVVCGPLPPGRVTAWLDFPLSGAILCNVTDTSLKQHCHCLLSGSIFSYWHFPVSEEHGAYQENETSEGIFLLLFSASMKDRKKRGGFVTLTEIRSCLSLQGVNCRQHFDIGSITEHHIKLLDPQVQRHFINYAQRLNMQAYWLSWEHSVSSASWRVCVSISEYNSILCNVLCLYRDINHEISKGIFDKPTL